MWETGSSWPISGMKSDFLRYVIFHAFIIMKLVHRSFVMFIDRILSDAEMSSFVGNDPNNLWKISRLWRSPGRFPLQMKAFQHPTIYDLWTSQMIYIVWSSQKNLVKFHDNECMKYHIQQKVRFHSINWSRRSSSSHFALYGVHNRSMEFTK